VFSEHRSEHARDNVTKMDPALEVYQNYLVDQLTLRGDEINSAKKRKYPRETRRQDGIPQPFRMAETTGLELAFAPRDSWLRGDHPKAREMPLNDWQCGSSSPSSSGNQR
jgi:hypothetical protein